MFLLDDQSWPGAWPEDPWAAMSGGQVQPPWRQASPPSPPPGMSMFGWPQTPPQAQPEYYNMGMPPQYGYRGLSSLGRKVSPKADVAQGVVLRAQEVNSNSFVSLAARDVDDHVLCHEPIVFDAISWKAPSTQRSVAIICRLRSSASFATTKLGFGTIRFQTVSHIIVGHPRGSSRPLRSRRSVASHCAEPRFHRG